MSKYSLFIFALFFTSLLFSQNLFKPDYKKIEKEVLNKKSKYFYDNLMDRFIKSDTTLTSIDNHYLYYGYSFNEKYNPYNRNEKIETLNKLLNIEDVSKIDFDQAQALCEDITKENPFDLRTYNALLFVLDKKGQKDNFNKVVFKVNTIVDTIMKSGDGKSKESPFYVINVSHEYDLINILGLQYGGKQSLIDKLDFLTLKENKFDLKGFYFDVTPSFNYLEKSFGK